MIIVLDSSRGALSIGISCKAKYSIFILIVRSLFKFTVPSVFRIVSSLAAAISSR